MENESRYLKVATEQPRTIKFAVRFETQISVQQLLGQKNRGHAVLRQAATLRAGGAMNSGPTGSVMASRKIRSISALAEVSSDQPIT